MKRPLKPEERHIWGMVAATVHPLPGKATPQLPSPQGCTDRGHRGQVFGDIEDSIIG
jgi:hypothetical protein